MTTFTTLESGTGLPLLLLHGIMGKPDNWRGCFADFPPGSHAIALRFPFFEDDAHLAGVQEAVAYTRAFLDAQHIHEVVLCGNSLGGHVALDLALTEPQRVRGLVLAGSSGLFERSFTSIPGLPPKREWIEDRIRDIFYDPVHAVPEIADEVCRIVSSRRHIRELVRVAMSAKRDNVASRLHGILCPTLLIWGRQDIITPPSVAEEFHRLIPDSELQWFDRCGHTPMIEHPRQFATVLADWWARHIERVPVACM